MTDKRLTLAFVGDMMIGRRIDARLDTVSPEDLWGDVLPLLRSADAVVGNLECPITTHRRQWWRTWKTFHFRGGPRVLDILRAANVRLVNLANNHMLDFHEQGLVETLDNLQRAGIAYGGGGVDAYDAGQPGIASVAGRSVALIGLTDAMAEWAAGHRRPGTNHIPIRNDGETLALIRHLIADARDAGAEIVILSCHWGPNMRVRPPGRFRAFARHAIELGADVVHGHSAHLFQGVEAYGDGLILYDTGGILDDYWTFPGFPTDRGFVFAADFDGTSFKRLRMTPVVQARTSVALARGDMADAIRATMIRRCARLGTPVAVRDGVLEVTAPAREPAVRPVTLRPRPAVTAAPVLWPDLAR